MDTTETYIKMNACEEIRGAYSGDLVAELANENYFVQNKDIYLTRKGDYIATLVSKGIVTPVWLPRQDQLQEMLDSYPENMFRMTRYLRIMDEMDSDLSAYLHKWFKSMEQLWLAFCMSEKYNKYWSGEEWIKRRKDGE